MRFQRDDQFDFDYWAVAIDKQGRKHALLQWPDYRRFGDQLKEDRKVVSFGFALPKTDVREIRLEARSKNSDYQWFTFEDVSLRSGKLTNPKGRVGRMASALNTAHARGVAAEDRRKEPWSQVVEGIQVRLRSDETGSADRRGVNSGESKWQKRSADERQTDSPRTVVAKWIDLLVADNVRDSRLLTTKSVGRDAHRDLSRFKNRHKVRVVRSLGNESIAVVVTNTVKHVESGKGLAFAFWLVLRDGSWLIYNSAMRDPEIIEEQLRGFSIGGGGSVKWRVTKDDVVGTWLGDGVGGLGCESRFQLKDNGTFIQEMWGPAGRSRAAEVKRGIWRLEEDRIIWQQEKQRLVSRVSWMGNDLLVLQSADGKSLDGRSGTHHQREQVTN